MRPISIIVVKCSPLGEQVYGDRLSWIVLYNLREALSLGTDKSKEGVCVIVRPSFNEEDVSGHFFREWRSFNGSPLKECRFNHY